MCRFLLLKIRGTFLDENVLVKWGEVIMRIMKVKHLVLLIVWVFSAVFTITVQAEEDEEKGWEFEFLVGALSEPTYVGSDKNTTEAAFNFEATYQTDKGVEYFIGLGELGTGFEFGDSWEFIAMLEYEEGRNSSDDAILAHFPRVRNTVEGQFSLSKHINNWTVSGVIQPDLLDRGKGLVYFLALERDVELTPRLSMNTVVDISFANAEHMNTEVGITNSVAALSGLNVYNAGSGYKSTSLGNRLSYKISEHWTLMKSIEFEFYGSNISDSPLVKDEGDDINYSLGLGLSYSF